MAGGEGLLAAGLYPYRLRLWAIGMFGKNQLSRWLVGAAILAVAEFAGVVAVEFALTIPAQAQRDDRYPFLSNPRQQRGGGFFQDLFGVPRQLEGETYQAPVDYSRAPSPRKPDKDAPPPTTSIVVLGDGMADWLASGLEDAFSDNPEIGIVRKNRNHSGLLRYDQKGDLDWWHAARDILGKEKANYVVMMLGISDRQSIRAQDLAKEAEKKNEAEKKEAEKKEAEKKKAQADKPGPDKSAPNKNSSEDQGQPSIIAPEAQQSRRVSGTVEFRTDQWAEIYSRRIDETVAALKSKGVPVFWVGLPSIRGPRPTADAVYLNDLYRARAERAGAIYVDVWDGFVDEGGKFSQSGPDFEGQMRRLRSSDGTYFTKYGARKLAHYVERELRRHMNSRALPVALPSGPIAPVPADGKSAVRPLAGPVVPLTVTPGNSDELLGGAGTGSAHGDATASRVLVKGEPVAAAPGRADDFGWPRANDPNNAQPMAALPASAATEKRPAEPKSGAAGKTTQNAAEKPKVQRQPRNDGPRPVQRSGNPLGWLR